VSLSADLQTYRDRLASQLGDAQDQIPTLEPSSNAQEAIDEAAAALPFALPPSIVEYLTAPVVPGIEWNEIAVPTNKDLDSVFGLLNRSELWPAQLAQIATGPNCDPVCLDLSRALYDGEYPVVVIKHDRVPDDGWSDAKKVRKSVSLEFSDFAVMLHLCCQGMPLEFRTKFGK
jgi:hypothetical protein